MVKYVSRDARRVAILRRKMQAVEIWADRRGLTSDARRKIRAFYAEIWMAHAGEEVASHSDIIITAQNSRPSLERFR